MDSYHKFENDTVDILAATEDFGSGPIQCNDNGISHSKTKDKKNHSFAVNPNQPSAPSDNKQRLRLTAVESEIDFFLKVLRVSAIKKLLLIQVISIATILICQITLYAIVTTGYYKPVDASGMGIWGPLFIFSVASGLTLLTIRGPTGCMLGTAMGFQIVSAVFGSVLIALASISLVMHGRMNDDTYDPEVGGRVMCSFMILASVAFVITCIFISVQFCRATCCGRYRGTDNIMFDAEVIRT